MRGPGYEKNTLDKVEKLHTESQYQRMINSLDGPDFTHFVGNLVIKLAALFILSIPLAFIATKITPENLVIMNKQAAKYLHYLQSLLPQDLFK